MSVVEDSFEYLDAPVERIAGADVPMPYAANLERMAVPQVRTGPFAFIYVCIRICGYTTLVAGLVALQEKKKNTAALKFQSSCIHGFIVTCIVYN